MRFEVAFGGVSWINAKPNPIYFAGAAMMLEPAWAPKTYVVWSRRRTIRRRRQSTIFGRSRQNDNLGR